MRKYFLSGFIISATFMLIWACNPTAPVASLSQNQEATIEITPNNGAKIKANLTDGCVETYSPEVDYFPEKVKLTYTNGFSVQYYHNYKLVIVDQSGLGENTQIQYLLVQCGTPPPEAFAGIKMIYVPVKTIVSMSTNYIPFLDQYGLLDRLVAIDDITYVNNQSVIDMVNTGKLVSVGSGAGVNIEMILDLQPDLIMAYNSGVPDYDAYPKINEAGLNVVLNGDNLETTPLGRAEWGKFIALFFNKEAEAEQLYNKTASKYEGLVKLAASAKTKPAVFVNVNYQGTWYMSGGKSYVAQFLSDAGANYLWADELTVGELMLSFEEVLNKAVNADYWVNTGFWNSAEEALADDVRYGEFAAFKNNRVYNNNARSNVNGGNDYFESGVANPDIILADLIKIFHPELLHDHQLYYYHQLTPMQ